MEVPWHRLRPGQGVFVPCLDMEATKARILQSAVTRHFRAELTFRPVVYKGLLGLSVFRGKLVLRKRPRS